MRTLNRLITTFDEVRHAKIACAIHGVEPETCTAEVSSGRSLARKRPARTPPSTFLFLLIHLSKNVGPETIPPSGTSNRRSPSPRRLSEACSPLSVRSFRGAPSRRGGGRAEWGVYRPRLFPLSTPVRKNLKDVLAPRLVGFSHLRTAIAPANRSIGS